MSASSCICLINEDCRARDSGARQRDFFLTDALAQLFDRTDVYGFAPAVRSTSPLWKHSAEFHLVPSRPWPLAGARWLFGDRLLHSYRFDHRRHGGLGECVESAPLVYASMIHAASYCAARSRRGALIFDTHNFDPDVWQVRQEHWGGTRKVAARMQLQRVEGQLRQALRAADGVIACTERDLDLLLSRFDGVMSPEKASVISNGADLSRWTQLRERGDLRSQGKRAIFFGSLDQPSPGAAALFLVRDVWPRVISVDGEWQLSIAGKGPPQALQEAITASENVRLYKDVDDMPALVRQHGLVLIPEPFGTGSKIKVYEALASGKPTVASHHAAVGIGRAMLRGLELRPLDPGVWASEVLRSGRSRSMSAVPLRAFEREGSWSASGRKLQEFVTELKVGASS